MSADPDRWLAHLRAERTEAALPRCSGCKVTRLRTERDRAAGICRWCATPPPVDVLKLWIGDRVLVGAAAARFLAAGRLADDETEHRGPRTDRKS